MLSAAKLAANQANAQLSTGPTSETGRATSSKNATKAGLFSNSDFVLPGDEPLYNELDEALRADLVPQGYLEHHLVDEIRRVMWRLRRCGEVEAAMAVTCSETLTDAMQNEATAHLQHSVDRARSQCHRLFNRCTAELRKLQTERQIRNETMEAGTVVSHFGLSDMRAIGKAIHEQTNLNLSQNKLKQMDSDAAFSAVLSQMVAIPDIPEIFDAYKTPVTKQTQTARNAECPCKSGLKYKRCCGKNAPAMLHAA